ncbi:MAG TPA: hypoxanthine phosphoribosyltransferase [Nitrospirota bacterium]|nr:hypoxanthine phosphoribosyltransferase [Nitrospirota bacterium]
MFEIQEILFDEQTIQKKVRELAAQISRDYAGEDLVLVCILKGAVVFTADLMRSISFPVTIDFICASSYGMSTTAAREIRIKKDIEIDVRGRHVLLVDTIIDTGETLACLFKRFAGKDPASLEAVVLLDKKPRRTVEVRLKYRGFEIPDKFVVGYGVDCAEQYRNLPYVAVIKG